MKSIFYLLTILFLSLLISCSEEPPTSVDVESLTKKPIKDPPDPLILLPGDVHIIAEVKELIRGKYRSTFRVWSNPPKSYDPQIREIEGTQIKVAIYDINDDGIDELLVYHYYTTGKGRHAVEHFELQIWQDGDVDTASTTYNLDGFLYLDIVIGELDGNYAGDEIVLGGYHMGASPEIRVFNPNYDPEPSGFFNTPIKTFNTSAYGAFGKPVIIGDVAGTDGLNEIIFGSHVRRLAVLDYSSGVVKTYDTNEQLNAIAVGYVEGNGLDEIIWGGYSGEIHILEIDGNNFNEKWVSEDLGGQIWSLAAGNFDEDSEYEIAVTTIPGENQGIFYVFDYDDGTGTPPPLYPPYAKITIEPIGEGAIARMFAGNANNDPAMKKDLVVGTSTSVRVYDAPNGYTPPLFNVDIGAMVGEIYLK